MPRSANSLAKKFERELLALESSRSKIEDLSNRNEISLRDKKHFYEGLFLKLSVLFENYLETLFFGLLVSNNQSLNHSRRDVKTRVTVRSHLIAKELILGPHKRFIDWVPYDKTKQLANIYFRGGRPFTLLSPQQEDDIYKCSVIRNVIAHESKHSKDKYYFHIIGNTPIPPREKHPAYYLMSAYRTNPNQSRFELYSAKLKNIAYSLI